MKGRFSGRFGGRRHYNPLSPEFQAATRRIVQAMADRFGESSLHHRLADRQRIQQHFRPIRSHPRRFPPMAAQEISAISINSTAPGETSSGTPITPTSIRSCCPLPASRNMAIPIRCLDASRFWSWAFAAYNRIQTDILQAQNRQSIHHDQLHAPSRRLRSAATWPRT